jgi:hypothetical protein
VAGGYESNEVWGGEIAEEEESDADFYGLKGDGDAEGVGGEDGGYHYTDAETGRACFQNASGVRYFWDETAEAWVEIERSEAKGEQEEVMFGAVEQAEEAEEAKEVPAEEPAARPHEELYKNKFKVSTTKRRPPPPKPQPKAQGKRAPPPKIDTKRLPPARKPPPGAKAPPPKSPGMYQHEDDDDAGLQLMEAVASHNMRYIRRVSGEREGPFGHSLGERAKSCRERS